MLLRTPRGIDYRLALLARGVKRRSVCRRPAESTGHAHAWQAGAPTAPSGRKVHTCEPQSPRARQEHTPISVQVKQRPKSPGEACKKDWPHAPRHALSEFGAYMVTAATWHAQHLCVSEAGSALLEQKLLELTPQHVWQLEAWAVFSNYCHFVGH